MKYGYKAFDKDLKCREFQFEIGKLFEAKNPIQLCMSGFHYCENLKDVYNYYKKSKETRVCKILDLSEYTQKEIDKSCTDKLVILEEVSQETLNQITDSFRFNSGYGNSGYHNSGDYNSGNRNSGYGNSGNHNSGYHNSGYGNSGYRNSGDYNSGNRNSGYGNSGNCNSGDRNSGDYNSGNRNSGYCNSNEPTVRLFNKDSKLKFDSVKIFKFNNIVGNKWKQHLVWVSEASMTDVEKTDNPSHKATGGFLRKSDNDFKKSWANVIDQCSKEEIKFIKSLPGFTTKCFFEITGCKL